MMTHPVRRVSHALVMMMASTENALSMNSRLETLLGWWHAASDEVRLAVWLVAGIIGLVAWFVIAYLALRRLANHRKFGGRWYSAPEYGRLMQVLWEDQQAGTRVMSPTELRALRKFRYGGKVKSILADKGGGYFDV